LRPLQLGKRARSETANEKPGESPTKKQKINPESQLPKMPQEITVMVVQSQTSQDLPQSEKPIKEDGELSDREM